MRTPVKLDFSRAILSLLILFPSMMVTNRQRAACRLVFCWLLLLVASCSAQDEYDEYVRQVVDEDQSLYDEDDNAYNMDERQYQAQQEELRRKQEESLRRQMEDEERRLYEETERRRREREATFEQEVAKMNEQQAKVARKQKKKDAKIVKRVLRAAQRGNHYAVIGLHNFEIQVPPRSVRLGPFGFTIPGFSVFHISDKAIRKQYRELSRQVHPDRNRDGRAEEAFIALENSASILADEQQRKAYDEEIRSQRMRRRQKATDASQKVVVASLRGVGRVVGVVRSLLGPFAFPTLILGSILI